MSSYDDAVVDSIVENYMKGRQLKSWFRKAMETAYKKGMEQADENAYAVGYEAGYEDAKLDAYLTGFKIGREEAEAKNVAPEIDKTKNEKKPAKKSAKNKTAKYKKAIIKFMSKHYNLNLVEDSDDILKEVSFVAVDDDGAFHFVKVNYSNSYGIPLEFPINRKAAEKDAERFLNKHFAFGTIKNNTKIVYDVVNAKINPETDKLSLKVKFKAL